MIDEKARRRPEFIAESAPVALLDGQEWYFPKPWVRFAPGRTVTGYKIKVWFLDRFDATLSEMVARRDEAMASGDEAKLMATDLEIAAYMLGLNYQLTDAEVEDLVQFGIDERASQLRSAFVSVLLGLETGPKPSTAGSDSL